MRDVVIIGAGVIGCAVAHELSRYRLDIAVIEKKDDVAQGASKANSGIVHAGFDAKTDSLKAKFNVTGNAMFEELCRELDVHFVRNGSLVLCFQENELELLAALKENGVKNGVTGLRILTREEVLEKEPNTNPSVLAALYAPTGGIVCPYDLTISLAESACVNGIDFLFNKCVKKVERSGERWLIHTQEEIIETRAVINCAGVYADEINNMVSAHKIHITARRGEYRMADKQYADSFHCTMFQIPTKMGKGVLVSPTVDGTVIIGPTAADIADKSDTATTPQMLQEILEKARFTWKNLPVDALITTFAGIRAHSSTDDFIIGEQPDAPEFFNAAGIESPGLSSAPAIGKYLAECIIKKLHAGLKSEWKPIPPKPLRFRELDDNDRIKAIQENPEYAQIVCRCECVTAAEIRAAVRRPLPARSIDAIKRRTRAGMGRCQGGFCSPIVLNILCEELGLKPEKVTKCGGNSQLLTGKIGNGGSKNA